MQLPVASKMFEELTKLPYVDLEKSELHPRRYSNLQKITYAQLNEHWRINLHFNNELHVHISMPPVLVNKGLHCTISDSNGVLSETAFADIDNATDGIKKEIENVLAKKISN